MAEKEEPILPGKRPIKNRLCVVETVYHQQFTGPTEHIESRFQRYLKSEEQTYQRICKATQEWQALDCGWIEDCSHVHIENQAGKYLQQNPTEEEKEQIAAQVLEVSYFPPHEERCWTILPGESFRGCPSDCSSLFVRSRSGTPSYSIHLIPG
jgi:hypothetical protein